jgi:hypothetical protein
MVIGAGSTLDPLAILGRRGMFADVGDTNVKAGAVPMRSGRTNTCIAYLDRMGRTSTGRFIWERTTDAGCTHLRDDIVRAHNRRSRSRDCLTHDASQGIVEVRISAITSFCPRRGAGPGRNDSPDGGYRYGFRRGCRLVRGTDR